MKTYNFPFGRIFVTIIDPTIEVVSVQDIWSLKKCTINIVLESAGNRFAMPLHGFTYETSYTKSDISNFVQTELLKYEVTE